MDLRVGTLALMVAVAAWAAVPGRAAAQGIETDPICRALQKQHGEDVARIGIPLGGELVKARSRITRAETSERFAADAIRAGCQRLAKTLWTRAASEYQRAQRDASSSRVTSEARRKGTEFIREVTTLRFDIRQAQAELQRTRAKLTRLHGSQRPRVGKCRTKDQQCPLRDKACQEALEKLPLCPK